MTRQSRDAGFCETLSYVFHDLCFNDSICALKTRISGPLTEKVARLALFWCQNRHPMLHAKPVTEHDGNIKWYFDEDFATNKSIDTVPLSWRERVDGSHVERVIDAELAEPDVLGEYPWRSVILSDGVEHDVVFLIPHYMTDATSFIHLFKLFLENCELIVSGRSEDIERSVLPIPLPLDCLLPSSAGGLSAMMDEPEVSDVWPWQGFAPRQQRESRNIWFSVDSTTTRALIGRCKENGVSVNSVLSAAYLLATDAAFFAEPEPRTLAFSTAVSLRPYCEPPYYDNAFAWHIAQYSFAQALGGGFWEVAAGMGENLAALVDEQERNGFFPAEFDPGMFSTALGRMFDRDDELRVFGSPVISNMGVVDVPENFGPFAVDDLCWTTKQVCGRNLASLYTLTLHGRMSFCLAYIDPLLGDRKGQAIVGRIVETIDQIAAASAHFHAYRIQRQN